MFLALYGVDCWDPFYLSKETYSFHISVKKGAGRVSGSFTVSSFTGNMTLQHLMKTLVLIALGSGREFSEIHACRGIRFYRSMIIDSPNFLLKMRLLNLGINLFWYSPRNFLLESIILYLQSRFFFLISFLFFLFTGHYCTNMNLCQPSWAYLASS